MFDCAPLRIEEAAVMQIPCSTDFGSVETVLSRAVHVPAPVPLQSASTHGFGGWAPRLDVKVIEREVVVYADLPGMDEDHLCIEVLPDSLTVEGDRSFDHDQEDAEEFIRLDRPYGPFAVRIDLPLPVDPNQATAKYRRGVLRIRMPVADRPYRGMRVHP